MTLDDISCKGDSYDFRGGGSSEDWEINEGGNDRREAQVCHAGNGVLHAQSKELSLKHHLKLMAWEGRWSLL